MTDTALAPTAHTWQLPSPPTIREVVTDRVRRAILDQEIRPGTRVRQTQLADALGVSRMPVRDAIQDLVAEGLLRALPGGGVQVPDFDVDDVLDALALRGPLETEALRSVVARRTTASEVADLLRSNTGLGFHRSLVRLSGNRYLTSALTPIWTQAERGAVVVAQTSVCRPGSADHEAIAHALANRDLTAATQTLVGHLAAVCDEVAEGSSPTRAAS